MQCDASATWAPRTASCIGEGKDKSWSIKYIHRANNSAQKKYKDDDDTGDVRFVSSSWSFRSSRNQ